MKPKVVVITTAHPAFDVRIYHKQALTLVSAGYAVTLIAPSKDEVGSSEVRHKFLPYPKSRRERMSRTVMQAFVAAMGERADLYHFHDPEFIPAGFMLVLLGKKVIYDIHEDLPKDILDKHWIHPWLRNLLSKATFLLEKTAAWVFSGIIAATPGIAQRFPKHKTAIVYNAPRLEEISIPNPAPYLERPYQVIYVGALSKERGVFEMAWAIDRVSRYEPKLLLAGKFSPEPLQETFANGSFSPRVVYLGWQDRDSIAELLSRSRVGLVTLHPIPGYLEAYPIKLFEYMAAGIPVIASDFPLWRSIVSENKCGLLVDPLDPAAIAEAIEHLFSRPEEAAQMGRNGQKAVESKFNWGIEAEKLLQLYRQLLG